MGGRRTTLGPAVKPAPGRAPPTAAGYQPPPKPEGGTVSCGCACCCCSCRDCADSGRWPSLTVSVLVWPLRETLTCTLSPGLKESTTEVSAEESSTALPPSEVITSPAIRPPSAAGPSEVSWPTCAPAPCASPVVTPR